MKINKRYVIIGYLGLILCLLSNPHTTLAQKSGKKSKSKSTPDKQLSSREQQMFMAAYIDAESFFMIEEFAKAKTGFDKAYTLDPKNAAVNYKLAQTLERLNQVGAAIPYAEASIELDPKNKYYYLQLSELYRKELKLDLAAKTLEKLIKTVKGNKEYHYDLASIYLYMGKYEEAMANLNEFENYFGLNEEVVKQKQYVFLRQNKLDKALQEGQKLILAYPDEPRYVINQAEILISNNKNKEAKLLLETLLASREGYAMAHLSLYNLYKADGDHIAAEKELKKAFNDTELSLEQKINIIAGILGNPTEENLRTAKSLTELTLSTQPDNAKTLGLYGDILYTLQEKESSREAYTKSVKFDPTSFNTWRQLIILDYELQQFDTMVKHATEAAELFPAQGIIWFFKGTGELVLKNYAEAAKSLEQAKLLTKSILDIHLQVMSQLGDAYHYLEQHAKSDSAYEEVLQKDPKNAIALNNYAYFLSLRGVNLEKAKEMSGGLVEREPNNSTYLDTYGWILYKMKDFENAKIYLEKAVAADSGSGVILEHYGDVLYQLGEKEKALENWIKAKEKGDTSQFLDRKIADKKLYE